MPHEAYLTGLSAGLGGEGLSLAPTDVQSVKTALSLLDKAVVEAQKILEDNSGWIAQGKALATGVNLGAIKGEVDALVKAAISMRASGDRLLASPNATHEKVARFVKDVYLISDLSVLKESASRNELSTLVKEVSSQTAKDLEVKAKALSVSIWDALPWYGKVGVVGVPLLALWFKIRD